MSERILLVDDEDLFREDLASLLREEGFLCTTAPDGRAGIRAAESEEPDIVLTDLVMPEMGGLEVVEAVSLLLPETPILVITAYGSVETAVEAFRKGATDYLLKPVIPEDLFRKVRRCLEHRRLLAEVRHLRREVGGGSAGAGLVGRGPSMERVHAQIEKVAPLDCTVLLSGESGTGKELVARAIHDRGPARDGPFVAVNCAAIPRDLFESELFGHVRGAFTSAMRDRTGYFELARGGTLFLDEISEIPIDLQAKLLRVIEQREFVRVGGGRPIPMKARLLAATHQDLQAEIAAGRFREDLYYRIHVVEIHLPPLRERREDIPLLAEHFLRRLGAKLKRPVLRMEPSAMRALIGAPWRGNVRELENVLERSVILASGDSVDVTDLPGEIAENPADTPASDDLRAAVRAFQGEYIRRVLAECGGNREEASRRLGVNVSTLYRHLKDSDA